MTERRKASGLAIALFAVLFVGILSAATWFALRDASTAKLELADAASKPVTKIEGAAFDTTHSAYSVAPPPIVDAIKGGAQMSSTSAPLVVVPAGTTEPVAAAATPGPDGYVPASFRTLAGFDYGLKALSRDESASTGTEQRVQGIPAEVRALSGRKVSVTGFMMPIEFSGGRVRSFLLMKNQLLCCFGIAPRLNDFVAVRVTEDKGTAATKDVPITAKGVLEVGEVISNGVPLALYTMRADEVMPAE